MLLTVREESIFRALVEQVVNDLHGIDQACIQRAQDVLGLPPIDADADPRTADDEAFGGTLLLGCALTALIWANSPWGETYDAVWSTELTLGTVQYHLTRIYAKLGVRSRCQIGRAHV